jgi:hypothetical protein
VKLFVVLMVLLLGAPALAAESWEDNFGRAAQALEARNYWEAHRIFNVSLDEAERSKEDVLLAQRLESLAESYATRNRPRVAETLHKKAIEIFCRRLGKGHAVVAESIDKFVRAIKRAAAPASEQAAAPAGEPDNQRGPVALASGQG